MDGRGRVVIDATTRFTRRGSAAPTQIIPIFFNRSSAGGRRTGRPATPLYRVKVQPNRSVAVIRTGGVGLNVIQGARFVGAHPIIALDILDSKLEMVKTFGATHTLMGWDNRGVPLSEKVDELYVA